MLRHKASSLTTNIEYYRRSIPLSQIATPLNALLPTANQTPHPKTKETSNINTRNPQSIVPNVPSVAIPFRGLDFPLSSVVGLRCLKVKPTNKLLFMGSSLSAMFSSAVCLSWTSLYLAISASFVKSSK